MLDQVYERVFLGVSETIVGSLLCCCVDIVQCLFNQSGVT